MKAAMAGTIALILASISPPAAARRAARVWKTSWAHSVQGPYPFGDPMAHAIDLAAIPPGLKR